MPFQLIFTRKAADQLSALETDQKKLRRVRRCLAILEHDPRYAGLNSHKYRELKGVNGEDIWESYVENNSPSAWRVFWHYGPQGEVITVVSIEPHQ